MIQVEIIEGESGGEKVDEVKEFSTKKEANNFIRTFNAENYPKETPDWYMYARIRGEYKEVKQEA